MDPTFTNLFVRGHQLMQQTGEEEPKVMQEFQDEETANRVLAYIRSYVDYLSHTVVARQEPGAHTCMTIDLVGSMIFKHEPGQNPVVMGVCQSEQEGRSIMGAVAQFMAAASTAGEGSERRETHNPRRRVYRQHEERK